MPDRKVLRREPDGTIVENADLSALAARYLSDMLVDYEGNAGWATSDSICSAANQPAPTAFIRVAPDGTPTIARTISPFPMALCSRPTPPLTTPKPRLDSGKKGHGSL